MINWTDEAVRAEADYRRDQLRRMVSRRRATDTRTEGARHRWLPGRQRH